MPTPESFTRLVAEVTRQIAGRPVDDSLADFLNREIAPGSAAFDALAAACREGVAAGWLCQNEHGGIRYGRPLDASDATHGFSVDVVDMPDVVGPHHSHPNGEIDMVMPLEPGDGLVPGGAALFDGQGAGWKVYGPGSAHRPTTTQGRALVLYLLPGGAIEFTRSKKA